MFVFVGSVDPRSGLRSLANAEKLLQFQLKGFFFSWTPQKINKSKITHASDTESQHGDDGHAAPGIGHVYHRLGVRLPGVCAAHVARHGVHRQQHCDGADHVGGPVDELHRAEYWRDPVQGVRQYAGATQ